MGITERNRPKSQKKFNEKVNKSLDFAPQRQKKQDFNGSQFNSHQNMDRFKQGNVDTESDDYDSQVTSRHQVSESYSSELDCSSDASSESNGKSAYIQQLKQ